jgi:hypothetical protein
MKEQPSLDKFGHNPLGCQSVTFRIPVPVAQPVELNTVLAHHSAEVGEEADEFNIQSRENEVKAGVSGRFCEAELLRMGKRGDHLFI